MRIRAGDRTQQSRPDLVIGARTSGIIGRNVWHQAMMRSLRQAFKAMKRANVRRGGGDRLLTGSDVYSISIYPNCGSSREIRETSYMERGSVFMTNKTQAVRFPKSVRLPDGVTSVDIQRRGRSWVITPSEQSWAAWFESEGVSRDFMEEREQPADQERAAI
jgi:antitoxin VapB